MLNGGSMVWGFCVYFVYMIPLETDVLRKHRFQKLQGYFTSDFDLRRIKFKFGRDLSVAPAILIRL